MSTAALIGKGPSLDLIDWAAVKSDCDCFAWINETFLIAPTLGLPVNMVFGQDVEALELFKERAPANAIICTQLNQHHGGGRRFTFRAPWIEYADRQGVCASPQGYSTAANAICVLSEIEWNGEPISRLHLIGFDGLHWTPERWGAGPLYANCVRALNWRATAVNTTKAHQAYALVCDQVREALRYAGLEVIDHARDLCESKC